MTLPIASAAMPSLSDAEMDAFRALIMDYAGISLSSAKRQLVESRLQRRLRHYGYRDYGSYLAHLRERDRDGSERREFVACITTNKTDFLREPHHFAFLRDHVFAAAQPGRPVRIWSAGCSTGEEPWTIAMVAREHFGADAARRVRILASDIDHHVLAKAEAGIYADERLDPVEPAMRARHFLRGTGAHAGTVRVRQELRPLVQFANVNLNGPDWPDPGPFDVVFCRNVVIYFDEPTRRRLVGRFARVLAPGGHLILGHSETLHGMSDGFDAAGQTVYRRRGGAPASMPAPAPVRTATRQAARPATRTAASAAPPRRAVASVGRVPRGLHAALPAHGHELATQRIIAGGLHASAKPVLVSTLLGSCVAACIYDPERGVGGMNHFMLPDGVADGMPARYGVHAMELLINEVMKLGGDRRALRAKAFGGASVLQMGGEHNVAARNAEFIREFLAAEGIPLVAERLGGTQALLVRMQSHDGRVMLRALGGDDAQSAAQAEVQYRESLRHEAVESHDSITLF